MLRVVVLWGGVLSILFWETTIEFQEAFPDNTWHHMGRRFGVKGPSGTSFIMLS